MSAVAVHARIPVASGVDSLNVAVAGAIALAQPGPKKGPVIDKDKLIAGKVPNEIRWDIVAAAQSRESDGCGRGSSVLMAASG